MRACALRVGLAGLGLILPATAQATERWFLMSRHGDCAEVGSLTRKVPDLGDVGDPAAFVSLMRRKGFEVTMTRLEVPSGKAQEVRVPQKGLFLVFVTPEICRGFEKR